MSCSLDEETRYIVYNKHQCGLMAEFYQSTIKRLCAINIKSGRSYIKSGKNSIASTSFKYLYSTMPFLSYVCT